MASDELFPKRWPLWKRRQAQLAAIWLTLASLLTPKNKSALLIELASAERTATILILTGRPVPPELTERMKELAAQLDS